VIAFDLKREPAIQLPEPRQPSRCASHSWPYLLRIPDETAKETAWRGFVADLMAARKLISAT
jgi:hypothetical protein